MLPVNNLSGVLFAPRSLPDPFSQLHGVYQGMLFSYQAAIASPPLGIWNRVGIVWRMTADVLTRKCILVEGWGGTIRMTDGIRSTNFPATVCRISQKVVLTFVTQAILR